MKSVTRLLLLIVSATTLVASAAESPMLHPDFPIVEGRVQISKNWSISLPGQFNRRIEDGQLVLWRPGFTIWISAWNNDKSLSPDKQLEWIKKERSSEAFDLEEETDESVARFGYRLNEQREDSLVYAHYSYTASSSGYLQAAQYVDSEKDLVVAKNIWRSLRAEAVP